jgi:hypothetical protein
MKEGYRRQLKTCKKSLSREDWNLIASQNCNFHTLKSRAITGTKTHFSYYYNIPYM